MTFSTTQKNTALNADADTAPLYATDYHVYINHTDAGGIVYHANHLVFFENARRDWFTTLGLNGYFLQADDGEVQHFVVSQVALNYHKAIFLDDTITVTIDKVELKPASIIFYQSIYRKTPTVNGQTQVASASKRTPLSSTRIVIACVKNQIRPDMDKDITPSVDAIAPSEPIPTARPLRPIRVPQKLRAIIADAIASQNY